MGGRFFLCVSVACPSFGSVQDGHARDIYFDVVTHDKFLRLTEIAFIASRDRDNIELEVSVYDDGSFLVRYPFSV